MSCHQLNLIIFFMWELAYFSGIVSERICDLDGLFLCSDSETCEQKINSTVKGVCKCKKGFERLEANGVCTAVPDTQHPVLPTPESVYSDGSSVSAIVIGLLVPVLLVLVVGTLAFAAKKYRWLHRVRDQAHQLRSRHYDTVLINREDDPPLA